MSYQTGTPLGDCMTYWKKCLAESCIQIIYHTTKIETISTMEYKAYHLSATHKPDGFSKINPIE